MSSRKRLISPEDRVREFGARLLQVDGSTLFCRVCNRSVDHTRRQSITDHIASKKHKLQATAGVSEKRQCMLQDALQAPKKAAEAKEEVCTDFLSMLTSANIPLEKSDHPAVSKLTVHCCLHQSFPGI